MVIKVSGCGVVWCGWTYGAFAQPCGLTLGIGELEGRRKAYQKGEQAGGGRGRHVRKQTQILKKFRAQKQPKKLNLSMIGKKNGCKPTCVGGIFRHPKRVLLW